MTQQASLSSDIRPAIDQLIRKKAEISPEDHPYGLHTVQTGWNFADLERSALDAQRPWSPKALGELYNYPAQSSAFSILDRYPHRLCSVRSML